MSTYTCPMLTANCPICTKLIMPHSKQIECKICQSMFHMKCLSFFPNDHEHMRDNANIWYCSLCISQIFRLNNIEEYDIFLCELNAIGINEHTIESLSGRLFNPFQLNDKDYYTPFSQIHPDVNFYYDINSHLGLNCNYYMENSFYDLIEAQINGLTYENPFVCVISIYVAFGLNVHLWNLPWITLDSIYCNRSFWNLAQWPQLWPM